MRLQCAAPLFPSAEFVASETEVAFWSDPDLADKLPPAQPPPPGGRSPMNVSRLGSRPPPTWRRARAADVRGSNPLSSTRKSWSLTVVSKGPKSRDLIKG
jgi:hypothetical protein